MNPEMNLTKITVWDESAVRHILSRTQFGYTNQEVTFALSKTMDDYIDNFLLAISAAPADPGTWVANNPDPNDSAGNSANSKALVYWWYDLMRNTSNSFREKMVLFWHNHFVSAITNVTYPQYMYIQNKLFRQYAFGNMIALTKKVTSDPAMLIYLDGGKNVKNAPNENYARELMELFTLGIGNYTETDIKEAARALTGWRVSGLTSSFNSSLFDSGTKTFLGQTGNFNSDDIVNIIFSKDAAATFLATGLYKNFVFYEPDPTFVAQLAQVIKTNNFELKPVLSSLLKSEYFHSAEIRGSKIKSPVELIVGAVKQFQITTPDNEYLRVSASNLQQALFDPPDVRGWIGQRDWISTNTLPTRNSFTDSFFTGRKYYGGTLSFQVDTVAFARTFSSSENATLFIDDISKYFLQFPISQAKKDFLLNVLLDGTAVNNWSTYTPQASTRLTALFKALMRLPEFQLS